MATLWKTRLSLLTQLDAAIDSFEAAIRDCPDELWHTSMWQVDRGPGLWPPDGVEPVAHRTDDALQVFSTPWCISTHCAFHLDFYLSGPNLDGFAPPAPFQHEPGKIIEDDGAAALPEGNYSRADLLGYTAYCREKAHRILPEMTDKEASRELPVTHNWHGRNYKNLLRVNLGHVKGHAADIRRFLDAR